MPQSSLDLTPPLASQVIAGPATRPITAPVTMRDFGDSLATRRSIYDNALKAAQSIEPITDGKYTLKLANVDWADPERFTRKQRKDAVLRSETLARRLRGTWQLYDAPTNTLLEESKQTIAALPYLSSMGTFTHRGNEYTVNHQNRLMPGIFARVKNNGELESHVNVLPGKGMSHRYFLDPARGLFKIRLGQAEMPLLPLLHTLGATDQDVRNAWGDDLYAENYKHLDSGGTVRKLAQRLLRKADQAADEGSIRQKLTETIERMELDPEVTQRTLGKPFKNLNKDAILVATKKLLDVSRGQAEPDDRDHLAYQKLFGPEDLFAERIARDHSGIRRGLLKKVALSRSLKAIKPGSLTPQVEQVLLGSGLAQALEEINPLEIFDKQSRITRLGEGGIPSLESIPEEARSVQPSHMGYLDPLRTPESMRAGVDLQFSRMARKGSDGRVYSSFYSPKSGKTEWKSPQDIVDATVTTSDVLSDPFWQGVKRVPVMRGGKIDYVEKKDVDYVVPNFENVFSPVGNLVPFKSMAKGQRTSMAARMLTQALPLVRGEAPLVRSGVPGGNGRSFEEEYSSHMGAVAADKAGRVVSVGPGSIGVKYDDGTKDEIELYDHHPFNRKTFLHQTAMVQPGQPFKKGDLLARSNFTDDKGAMALGLNARVAYMPWEGYNYEDAIVISEAFAKRSASEHMYQHGVEVGPKHKLGKRNYVSLFPGTFDRKTLDNLDDKGLIRPGAEVHFGDPLILAAKERDRSDNKIHKRRQAGFQDETVTWDHHDPGIVTDVVMGKHGPVVVVKSHASTQVGDKLSGRYGDKGVIAAIVPDHEMPVGEDGKPMEVLLSDNGTISRTNPSQHAEAQLGKIASLTGKPVVVPDFEDPNDQTAWVQQQLAKYGIKDMEDVTIPKYGTKANVQTGNRFLMKLHHTSESKVQARSSGAYGSDDTPAKGGETGSKRISVLDTNALLSNGGVETLADARMTRGQKKEREWMQLMSGNTPQWAGVPVTFQKFVHQLRGAGVDVVEKGPKIQVMAMTNDRLREMTGDRVIKTGDTVSFDKELRPVPGGLFDLKLTGGHGGRLWSAIELPEPLPNPVMEEPIRRILGLTGKKFEGILGGTETMPGFGAGPRAIAKALDSLNLDKEIAKVRQEWATSRGQKRDAASRRRLYLESAKRTEQHPREWILDRVPVLPPMFRPVSVMGDKRVPLVSDPNYLYKELLDASKNYHDVRKLVGDEGLGDERLAIYKSFKAVTGLADPVHPKLVEKNVKGLLKSVFGASPKFGSVQRKLVSMTVDNVGRAVITPDPELDMDQIGVPENQAFQIYSRFIVRQLKRRGMPMREAVKHVLEKSPLAREMLIKEMDQRPVFANRAPVLHKFGIMAFRPKLVSGDVLKIPPLVVKGFNADFDGDAMQFHVPTTDKAVREAYERLLPSKSLISPADFKTPMHAPGQDYLAGLWHMTRTPNQDPKKTRRARTFRNKADVLAAYARGDISHKTEVDILEP